MLPEKIEKDLLRAAIAKPGAHKREIYRELLEAKKGADSTLSRAIDYLAACGYLKLDKNPGTIQVWPTDKAKRFIKKLDQGASE
jgi:hypothetical protein